MIQGQFIWSVKLLEFYCELPVLCCTVSIWSFSTYTLKSVGKWCNYYARMYILISILGTLIESNMIVLFVNGSTDKLYRGKGVLAAFYSISTIEEAKFFNTTILLFFRDNSFDSYIYLFSSFGLLTSLFSYTLPISSFPYKQSNLSPFTI